MSESALSIAKRLAGPRWVTRARCLARGLPLPRWGNLRRTSPFSTYFGFDRGTPIDRHYVDRFLGEWQTDITGDVLEIQVRDMTRRFGHDVRRSETVDIEARFSPTYLCDLAASEGVIPSEAYDCFLLPNTLTVLRDIDGCLRQALRVVKPGGVILATGVALCQLTGDGTDYWRMSPDGWREVTARVWPDGDVTIRGYGNSLVAVAAVMGLAVEELTPKELEVVDPRFPVLVGIRCRKIGAAH